MMRFAIVGAGAIGCALAARLAHAGADVTLVVRDPARAALIAGQGIACREGAVSYVARPRVARTVPDGGVDVLVMAVKAGDLPAVAASLPQGIGPQTLVMPLVNGIPWWLAGAGGRRSRRSTPMASCNAASCPVRSWAAWSTRPPRSKGLPRFG
jgi:2-dehydropantoate 2-reductase